jgi:hypothetical protein
MWRSRHASHDVICGAPQNANRDGQRGGELPTRWPLSPASGSGNPGADGRELRTRCIDTSDSYGELALPFCRKTQRERYHFPTAGKDSTKLRQNDTPILSAGAASLIV